jgi:Ca2+-binding RTX toxin-like protein
VYSFNGGTTQSVTIDGSSETLTMNSGTGVVTTDGLDYDDTLPVFTISTPRVVDAGGAQLNETLTVRLGLNDANDNLNGAATTNDQVIYGFGGNDTLTGGSGNDWISGGAGADTVVAGAGDDIIVMDTSDTSINGGTNTSNDLLVAGNRGDVMVVSGTVDFTALGDIYQGIETLSMVDSEGTAGADTMTLTLADVLGMADTGVADPGGTNGGQDYSSQEALRIDGDVGDTLNLQSGVGESWRIATGATGTPDGYTAYSYVTSGTNPALNETAYLYVQTGITVNGAAA